ncbi:RNA polymerase sigma factor [Sphingobium sufflavum]|uniref:RNA polymerase sigma factor n=1 Tax=Sphingobium sufflavum TaxID=1129547 RepID=UPI001F1CE863|nr:RNA polymerase sigma factor [Sphingobium sufflavum]MCE7796198.1 RNA polymerase sigma factor [Sphingobium sufflavum]
MTRPVASPDRKAFVLSTQFEDGIVALLPRLRRFAASLSRDLATGDDLCQMTIERALKARQQWAEGTRLDSWMYRIMRNLWIDEVRATNRRRQTFAEAAAGLAVGAPGQQEARTELAFVDRALAQLPDEQREAVLLVMVEGYGYQEAADIIGCPVGTLSSRFARGRDALYSLLEGQQ